MSRFFWKSLAVLCLTGPLLPVAMGEPVSAISADQLFAQGDFEAARQAYAGASAKTPEEVAPRLGLVRALLRLDRWEQAQTEAQAASRKFPKNADAHGLLALALIRAGWQPPYAAEAAESLTLDTGDYWGLVASGRAAEWDGRSEDARKLFRRASAARPDLPDALLGLLGALHSRRDAAEAAGVASKYLALHPRGQPHDRAVKVLSESRADAGAQGTGEEDEGLADTQAGPAALTVDFVGDSAVFPVTINGVRFRLLFDTGGGGGILLNRDAARRLRLPVVAHTVVYGAHGHEDAEVFRADTLALGGKVYRHPAVLAVGTASDAADGILSGNVFSDSVLTLDFEQRKVTLTQGKAQAPAPLPSDRALVLPWHFYRGHLFVRVSLNTIPLWAMLDTGDSTTILSLTLAAAQLKGLPKEQVHHAAVRSRKGSAIGSSDPQEEYIASRAESQVLLGTDPPTIIPIPTVGVSVLDRQVSPDFDFEIQMLLGMSSLTYARRVTFDYPRRLFTFEYRDPDTAPEPKKK